MSTKNLWTKENFSEIKQGYIQNFNEILESQTAHYVTSIPDNTGLGHTHVQRPVINFVRASNQSDMSTPDDNVGIVLGSDRPSTLASGMGAVGAQGAGAIDLVAGRMASAREGRGPEDGSFVNPSFAADAARVYISQLTNVDLNFGLTPGNIGDVRNRSAVAIKADGVRVIGRGGIKLVTGKSGPLGKGMSSDGEPNSLGGTVPVAPPIELIAGNNDGFFEIPAPFAGIGGESVKYLQGIARGGNTRDALRDLGKVVEEVIGSVYNLHMVQKEFNNILGITPIYPHAVAAPMVSMIDGTYLNALWQTRINKIMWEINHLETFGYKYICSKNVYST
tara:strand:+ start:105 stop:1109 length:1005 start_codon:yes stop_codon:yes gene_type:complete